MTNEETQNQIFKNKLLPLLERVYRDGREGKGDAYIAIQSEMTYLKKWVEYLIQEAQEEARRKAIDEAAKIACNHKGEWAPHKDCCQTYMDIQQLKGDS